MPRPQPTGELALRTVAMPADTNPAGDIFGGWIMSLMDLAAGVSAGTRARGPCRHCRRLQSELPPAGEGRRCGVRLYRHHPHRTQLDHAGVETWVLRRGQGERMKVTAAEFVLVAVDDNGRPRRLPDE